MMLGLRAIPSHLVSIDGVLRLMMHVTGSSSWRSSNAMTSLVDIRIFVGSWVGHHGRTNRGSREDMSKRQTIGGGRIGVKVRGLYHRSHARIIKLIDARMATDCREFVLIACVIVVVFVVVFSRDGGNHLELTAEDHGETIASSRFLDERDTCTTTPLIDFTAKGVRFVLKHAELPGRNHSVAAGSVNMGNRRIDDRGLGRATDLGQVGKESSQVLGEKDENQIDR